MCFDEGGQLFWRTFNRSTTLNYAEWHLAALSKAGSFYMRSAGYFAEPDHPRLNYAKTEIIVSPPGASIRGILAEASQPPPLVGTSDLELCMDVVEPLQPESEPYCHAERTNENGHWCCESGSLKMCLDESTQTFWRTFNRSTTLYFHEWYMDPPTSKRASYYAQSSSHFEEPGHPRINYEKTEIIVSPAATGGHMLGWKSQCPKAIRSQHGVVLV